jgi:hypothetical protein
MPMDATEHSGANIPTRFTGICFYIPSFVERHTEPCTDRVAVEVAG